MFTSLNPGMQEMIDDSKEEVQKARERKGKPAVSNLPTLYYTLIGKKITTERIVAIADNAAEIMRKNGYPGLRMVNVPVREAKKHRMAFDYQAFLAIKDDECASLPSVSHREPNTPRIGVFDPSPPSIEGLGWLSYINLDHSAMSGHSNPDYAAGYIVLFDIFSFWE